MLTIDILIRMWPFGDSKIPGLRQAIVDAAPAVFGRYGIDSPLMVAHLMAQLGEECDAGTEVVESFTYTTPERIRKVWPSRFPTLASAIPYLRSERKLADKVHNGQMGNAVADDRPGRYERLGRLLGVDLIGDPDWILGLGRAGLDRSLDLGFHHRLITSGRLPPDESDDVWGPRPPTEYSGAAGASCRRCRIGAPECLLCGAL